MLGLSKMNVSQVGRGPQVQQPPPSNRYVIKVCYISKFRLILCASPSFALIAGGLLWEEMLGNDCTMSVLVRSKTLNL